MTRAALVLASAAWALCGCADTADDAGAASAADGGGSATFEQVSAWVDAYATAHPGAEGDVTSKTADELAADPDAARLRAICDDAALPVFPKLAWEYGGNDHSWIGFEGSALAYCVYVPVSPASKHWRYDATQDHVLADVYLPYPEQNPCNDELGADRVSKCIGDPTNFEILVDTASFHDGADAGLSLAEASTELRLLLEDGTTTHLWDD